MKNLFKISLIFLVASLLFSSCGSISFTKRHYKNGYYIVSNKSRASSLDKKEKENLLQSEIIELSGNQQEFAEQKNTGDNSNEIPSVDDNIVVKEAAKKHDSKILQQFAKFIPQAENNNIQDKAKQIKRSYFEPRKFNSCSTNDEGLSVLWVLILVLLIIWIIGLASGGFGLGGLINVLLVIALILLILWLLRVI